MDKVKTKAQVLKAVNCPFLSLDYITGHSYWVFTYDDGKTYETRSVMVPRLNDMDLPQWVAEAQHFLAEVEQLKG